VLLRLGDRFLVEIEIGRVGGRVRRIVEDQRQRLRDRMAHGALDRDEELVVGLDRHGADHAACHQKAEGVDRIGRIRAQDDIARRGDRLRHIGEAFLGAERRDDLRVWVQLHAETAGVIGSLRLAKTRNTARGRVAVGARIAHDVAQFVDHGLRRRQIRISHAEIDDVGAGRSRARLQAVDLFEDVGRKAADLVKLFHRFIRIRLGLAKNSGTPCMRPIKRKSKRDIVASKRAAMKIAQVSGFSITSAGMPEPSAPQFSVRPTSTNPWAR
jgi:hypothetical protein